MFITYFNKTFSIENGTYPYFLAVIYFQLALVILVLAYYFLNIYIDIKTKQYTSNTQRIHLSIYSTCVSGHVILFAQRFLLIVDHPGGYDTSTDIFYHLSLIRAIFCIPSFYCLSAFVAERSFATYWLYDYEKNQRGWHTIVILILIYLSGVFNSYYYHNAKNTIPHISIFLMFTLLSYMANRFNFLLNRKYYFECQRSDGGGYSLAERFQISENIRFSFFFNQFAQSIAIFQICGLLCLLIDNLDISRDWKNLGTVVFDTTVLLYAIAVPFIVYFHNPKYQTELWRILRTFRNGAQKTNQIIPSVSTDFNSIRIQDTFGNRMVFNIDQQADYYFSQLRNSWG